MSDTDPGRTTKPGHSDRFAASRAVHAGEPRSGLTHPCPRPLAPPKSRATRSRAGLEGFEVGVGNSKGPSDGTRSARAEPPEARGGEGRRTTPPPSGGPAGSPVSAAACSETGVRGRSLSRLPCEAPSADAARQACGPVAAGTRAEREALDHPAARAARRERAPRARAGCAAPGAALPRLHVQPDESNSRPATTRPAKRERRASQKGTPWWTPHRTSPPIRPGAAPADPTPRPASAAPRWLFGCGRSRSRTPAPPRSPTGLTPARGDRAARAPALCAARRSSETSPLRYTSSSMLMGAAPLSSA